VVLTRPVLSLVSDFSASVSSASTSAFVALLIFKVSVAFYADPSFPASDDKAGLERFPAVELPVALAAGSVVNGVLGEVFAVEFVRFAL
jgi:hypothetical protein